MTTKNSPHYRLKAQADKIAKMLKAAERGEYPDIQHKEKIEAARQHPSIKAGIIMDDKAITLDLPWEIIRDASEQALSEYIIKKMQEAKDDA